MTCHDQTMGSQWKCVLVMCRCSGPVGSRVLRLYRAAVRIQETPQYYNTDGLNGEVCHILKSLRNFAVDLHTVMSFLPHTQIIFMQCVEREPYVDHLFFNVAESALAFTHSPGCMFITDQKAETVSPLTLEPAQCPLTICISQNPQLYSMASKKTVQQIRIGKISKPHWQFSLLRSDVIHPSL